MAARLFFLDMFGMMSIFLVPTNKRLSAMDNVVVDYFSVGIEDAAATRTTTTVGVRRGGL